MRPLLLALALLLSSQVSFANGNDYNDQNSYVGWKDEYVKKSDVERKEDYVKKTERAA